MFKNLQKILVFVVVIILALNVGISSFASGVFPDLEPILDHITDYKLFFLDSLALNPCLMPLEWCHPQIREYYLGRIDDGNNTGMINNSTDEDVCPGEKVNYFEWWAKELEHLSNGEFDFYCDSQSELFVKKYIIQYQIRTPIYFELNEADKLEQFSKIYDKLKTSLDFKEEQGFCDENCFFADNLYFMACKLRRYKEDEKLKYIIPWDKYNAAYKNAFQEMFKLIPRNCLQQVERLS